MGNLIFTLRKIVPVFLPLISIVIVIVVLLTTFIYKINIEKLLNIKALEEDNLKVSLLHWKSFFKRSELKKKKVKTKNCLLRLKSNSNNNLLNWCTFLSFWNLNLRINSAFKWWSIGLHSVELLTEFILFLPFDLVF